MTEIVARIFALAATLGPAGLFLMGIMDSSFLFMPLGNDLLMLGLTARRPSFLLIYAIAASLGSTAGTLLVDLLSRRGGEEGLTRLLPPERANYLKAKVKKRAGWAVALAALMPPPFPFTPIIVAASALQYPRRSLLVAVLVSRFVRFTIVGVLALLFGRTLFGIAKSPWVRYTVLTILVVSIVGSVVSVIGWVRRSRYHAGPETHPA